MVADLQAGGSGVKPVKKSSIKEKVTLTVMSVTLIVTTFTMTMTLTVLTTKKCHLGKPPNKKNGKKKRTLSPLGNPPLNGSKGDICCLITDKSA